MAADAGAPNETLMMLNPFSRSLPLLLRLVLLQSRGVLTHQTADHWLG